MERESAGNLWGRCYDKMNKTRVVAIQRWKDSHLQEKGASVSKVKARDETNERHCNKVRIVECRPYSKDKKWLIAEILERPPQLQEVTPMIQAQSWLNVADNTGAKKIMCISQRGARRRYAGWEIL